MFFINNVRGGHSYIALNTVVNYKGWNWFIGAIIITLN
jgi:hypothetical protein